MTPKNYVFFFTLMLGLLGCLVAMLPGTAALEENWGLHLLFNLRGERHPPREVAVVAIDRESADRLKLPLAPVKWPRSLHALLVERLRALGARVIVFDILFSDPQNPEDDERFARAMRRAGNVVLAQTLTRTEMTVTDEQGRPGGRVHVEKVISSCPELAKAAVAQGPFPLPRMPVKLSRYWTFKPEAGDRATLPVVVFQVFAKDGIGVLDGLLPQKSTFGPACSLSAGTRCGPGRTTTTSALRHMLLADPSLATRISRELDRLPPDAASDTTRRYAKALLALFSGPNSRYLDFYGPAGTIPAISYQRVLTDAGQKDLDFRGKAVFVGQTESAWPRVQDGFYHVYARGRGIDISGVEVAATAFANLLEGRSVHSLQRWQTLILIIGWGMAAALAGFLLPASFSSICLAAMAGIYLFTAQRYFTSDAIWLPIVVPLYFVVPLALVGGLAWNYRRASREHRAIRKAFGFYLPDEVVKQLAENSQKVETVGQVTFGICMMTDAARYTSVSESLPPEALKRFMNEYYQRVFAPIKANKGLVLQVIGDSVLALWSAPGPEAKLKTQACEAALGVIASVEDFNHGHGRLALPTRIGINAGHIALGNIGAMDHYEYRPVGDMVNTASRMEGLNKFLGTHVLVAAEMATGLDGFPFRPMGRFLFTGKKKATEIFQLLPPDWDDDLHQRICETFSQGLAAFGRKDWDRAAEAFQAVLALEGGDGPAGFYLEHCRLYKTMKLDKDWKGTVFLEHK